MVSLTGATGFLGRHIARAFADAGWRVRAVVRPGTPHAAPPGAEVVEAPLEGDPLAAAIDGTALLVHAAALVRAPDARSYARVNVEGTRAAVAAANRTGTALLFVSSLAAAGPGTPVRPRREEDEPRPISPYGRSKLAAERALRNEARVPWTIVRPSAVYGPWDRGFLPLFRLAARGRFPLAARPDAAFTLIEAGDLARALVLLADAPAAHGATLFLGHARPVTTDDLMRALAGAVGRPYRPRPVPRALLRLAAGVGDLAWRLGWQPPIDSSRYAELTADGFVCAVDRADALVGFRAETSLVEGLERTLRWYREQGWVEPSRASRGLGGPGPDPVVDEVGPDPAAAVVPAVEDRPCLLVADSSGRRFIALDKPVVTLGRRGENDVCVADGSVSRLHAEVIVEGGVCRIRDCDSRFGTFVNGERTAEQVLRHRDRIRLGRAQQTDIVFLVSADQATSSRQRSALAAASELRHMARLLDGLRAIGTGRVLDEVLALVLDAAIDVTGAERGFIMLAHDRGELEFTLARARGGVTLPGRTFQTSRKIPETVFATGRAALVDDLADEALAEQHLGTVALGIRHVLCAPLRLVRLADADPDRGEPPTIGVLYLDSRDRGTLHAASTAAALDTLSAGAAVAIENARLYREALERARLEQELKVAAAIQQSLLPPGRLDGAFFTVAAASMPCRSVGGDFFDYADLPGGAFGFILGDVAGKGSPAALLGAALLGMFSAEIGHEWRAAALLAHLNHGLLRRRIEARFATMVCGTITPDGTLTYANAGHNPPVLVTRDVVRRLPTGGLVLGLFERAVFEDETIRLEPGDLVVAFSDGVTEAENERGEPFGDERLLAAIAARRGGPAQDVLQGVLAEVRGFCGRALPTDDVTAFVLRYEGSRNSRSAGS